MTLRDHWQAHADRVHQEAAMTTPAEALKPCPFCGHETPYFERIGTPRQSCIVACGDCGARHESSDEGARSGSSWNTRAALAQAEQPAEQAQAELKAMTPGRAAYFMERFKREEKLLGPNEQAAVDFVIAMLEQAEQAQPLTYSSTQATECAGCGKHKHTPLRIDAMGGYVCLTCIDQKLGSMLGEFGYAPPAAQPAREFNNEGDQIGGDDPSFYSRPVQTEQAQPIGEVVIGEEGMTKGWTVIKWRADLPPVPVGTKLYAAPPAAQPNSYPRAWVGVRNNIVRPTVDAETAAQLRRDGFAVSEYVRDGRAQPVADAQAKIDAAPAAEPLALRLNSEVQAAGCKPVGPGTQG